MRNKRCDTSVAGGGELCAFKSRGRSWPVALALGLATVGAALEGAAETANKLGAARLAQGADQPRISVAATIVAEPASQTPLAIHIGPPALLPEMSFVRLRGLPPTVSLSEGHSIGPGSWAVPLTALPTLKADIPTGIAGRTEIVISLVNIDGTQLAEARTALVVGTLGMMTPTTKAPVELAAKRPGLVVPPVVSSEEFRRGERLVAQGDRYFAEGKVAGARLFFRQAADIGLALGAIRLAATYDPAELSRYQVLGITPDLAEARKWYERAREMGAPEAEQRLARLGGN
jgi:hypothetical protein